jgi:anti-anti-sigma regulatory factor
VEGGRVRLLLGGELDIAGVDRLDEVLDAVGAAWLPVAIDCRELTFVDVAGARTLLRATRSGATLEHPTARVVRVLELITQTPASRAHLFCSTTRQH